MRRVIVESPYAGATEEILDRNVRYARAACADCLRRGEAPWASHLLYTQPGILRDEIPEERALGIEAGLVWGTAAAATVVYLDLGLSRGMELGLRRAVKEGRRIELRTLDARALEVALGRRAAEEIRTGKDWMFGHERAWLVLGEERRKAVG